jgi:hypothetical protein
LNLSIRTDDKSEEQRPTISSKRKPNKVLIMIQECDAAEVKCKIARSCVLVQRRAQATNGLKEKMKFVRAVEPRVRTLLRAAFAPGPDQFYLWGRKIVCSWGIGDAFWYDILLLGRRTRMRAGPLRKISVILCRTKWGG